jgi:hypothetical protein
MAHPNWLGAESERLVVIASDIAWTHGHRPCIGNDCDLDAPCDRHRRTTEVVMRLIRMCGRAA